MIHLFEEPLKVERPSKGSPSSLPPRAHPPLEPPPLFPLSSSWELINIILTGSSYNVNSHISLFCRCCFLCCSNHFYVGRAFPCKTPFPVLIGPPFPTVPVNPPRLYLDPCLKVPLIPPCVLFVSVQAAFIVAFRKFPCPKFLVI